MAGLTGLEPDSPEARLARRMVHEVVRADIIRVTWDVEVAFAGAAAGGSGIMVIAGTGSVAFGRNARGQTARAGGYGFLIDDHGGGVSIGQAALRAVLQARDGRGPHTRLLPLITERLGDWPAIRRAVYGEGGRVLLASLVPLVARAAASHDAVARRILGAAGQALADLAAAVARRLDMREESFDLFTVGGVFAAGELVRKSLRRALRKHALRCRLRPPIFPPAIGAALLAMEAAGVPLQSAVLRQLKSTSAPEDQTR